MNNAIMLILIIGAAGGWLFFGRLAVSLIQYLNTAKKVRKEIKAAQFKAALARGDEKAKKRRKCMQARERKKKLKQAQRRECKARREALPKMNSEVKTE